MSGVTGTPGWVVISLVDIITNQRMKIIWLTYMWLSLANYNFYEQTTKLALN